jgi:uncharacterized protein with PIN domain
MQEVRLVVVYVFVVCPGCDEPLMQRIGRESPMKLGSALWHVSRLQEPRSLYCPTCGMEVWVGGAEAFAMPCDSLTLPESERTEEGEGG